MPYIKQENRDPLDYYIDRLMKINPTLTPGDLNYIITTIVLKYIDNKGGLNYTLGNDVVGVLECAKQEFYRRGLVPYENKKIKENGDCY